MSIALYRRYRPESFQEVIGQDHVTRPLMAALEAGRTTHAYLFSGPRGCGKTTSARILARCLNCVEYPTAKPCGKCESCRELARDGSGSLDVVELDAASHGGVDDARELREQAGFAPVRDRFKIFIIDEAHMVTNQGFNALLKLVEEPPPHVKFIFATTEPEKVIGTIRSRTHHYPFRLVPPLELEQYLALVCAREGVSAGKDLLSLVVRAGTGSVRDTLSVLDQIIGGSEGTRLDYDRAVALLGYTSAALLDDAVDAISTRDGSALFGVVDKVVKSGHDPRRFVEDMLQRLRDLVIIALAGDEAKDVFVSVPEDQYGRMVERAAALGAERASQCADLTNAALSDMAGATAPRLQLELLCARLVIARVGVPAQVVESGPEAPSPEVASSLAKFRAKPAGSGRVTGGAQLAGRGPGQPEGHQVGQQAGQAGNAGPGGQISGAQGVAGSVEQQRRLDQMDPRRRPMPVMTSAGFDGDGKAPAQSVLERQSSQEGESAGRASEGRAPQQGHADMPAPERQAGEQQEVRQASAQPAPERAVSEQSAPARQSAPEQQVTHPPQPTQAQGAPEQAPAQPAEPAGQSGGDPLAQISAQWPAIMADQSLSRIAHAQLGAANGPVRVEGGVLYVGFEQPGVAGAFTARGAREVERIIANMFGLALRVEGLAGGEPSAPKADAAQAAAPQPPAVDFERAEPSRPAVSRDPEHAPAGPPQDAEGLRGAQSGDLRASAAESEPESADVREPVAGSGAHQQARPVTKRAGEPAETGEPRRPSKSHSAAEPDWAPPYGDEPDFDESNVDDSDLGEPDPAHDPSFTAEPATDGMPGTPAFGATGGPAFGATPATESGAAPGPGLDQAPGHDHGESPERSAADILGSAAESFPMPPPAELPESLASGHANTTGHDPTGFAQFHVPPVEDPYTHTTLGKWAQPSSLDRRPDGPDPDDLPDEGADASTQTYPAQAAPTPTRAGLTGTDFQALAAAHAHPTRADYPDEPAVVDDSHPEWEGASADDPDISQSTMVGLQVLLERFEAKVIEEREE
ncbi:DNA polymerase III subunit gamma and tau [Trueperella bernardiae]|uniref:DNA polymerase III subunit gamma and tau n=1 Tax=Trueperella bernardiae TaxID=59561 RepID=UPI002043404A|nr:DNA polymerase III subunit gamma and tau [Trueperella bernardiae]